MSLKDRLTPKDTEEVRPNFFIQKRGNSYRQVKPIVWNSEWKTKEQLRSVFCFKSLLTFAIIIFIAWSYYHDTTECRNFLEKIKADPQAYCNNIPEREHNSTIVKYQVNNGDSDTIQDNP